ncbi:pre-mRNA splicing factor SR-like 1 isoform X1 [Andrographis paniculata]|uniref:pre-mRNA splicing factor SR-like 1 isoform X1 n=1 Tax=Andrographis paniculata TaxID=175694 RepID=UPI0021E90C0D|nr:pre-mRNA splicing factor SR-like 1 isoform X1 [Andrographis paniculata]XP_051117611.1 pre-mRNA splicing factor SR-like 1 isoform X1 [Andrographis paniculata]
MAEIKASGRPIDQLLEKVLCMNILSSDYFRDLLRLKTYHEVIDEIYVTVTHVEPWMTGNCRGPSTAFCLLYKFFIMKLTVKQMHGLLKHPDSPYIRAIGFLYLRYVVDPKTLWSWYEPYLKDDEEFSPGSSGRMTTMGVYIRDLLLGQYYFDTLLPRIPVPVLRHIVSNLENMKLPTKPCGVIGENSRASDDTARRPPSVKASLSVSFGQRAPHRASTRDSSPVRRTSTPIYDRDDTSRRSPGRRRSQSRDLSDREYSDRDRGRERDWDREDRYHRDKDPDRNRDRDHRFDYDRKSRDRDSYRSRSRSQSRSFHDRTGHDRICSSPTREKTSTPSNLAKLKDLYGDLSDDRREDSGNGEDFSRRSGTEEVIWLGGSSWSCGGGDIAGDLSEIWALSSRHGVYLNDL